MAYPRRLGVTNNPDGRPEMVFSDEQRRLVMVLAGMKTPHNIIARKVTVEGIQTRTLHKHFAEELEQGREQLISSLKVQIVQAAMKGSVRATTWLLERLDPEQFAPRYRQPEGEPMPLLPIEGGVGARVEIYLPDNSRGVSDVSPVTILAPLDESENG